ncbi:MAG TPA: YciI family protein [Nocardioides sp.]|uniref:YciI family protein n=1 Tax=Nocardioides sp. TaxID=35761 RepID=UPI002F3EAE06
MSRYMVLIPGDEAAWAETDQAEKERVYQAHTDFAKLLADRGHTFVTGAELAPSREGRVVSGDLDAVTVTDGPYAESAEQLSGFYVIDTEDVDDLCRCVGRLTGTGGRIEVRECRGGGM